MFLSLVVNESSTSMIFSLIIESLAEVEEDDIADEIQFLYSDKAEEIDEEDEDFGVSDQMKGVYNDS